MSEDVRILIDKSATALNKSNLLSTKLQFHDIFSATDGKLFTIIHKFLDAVERLPNVKEEEVPLIVIKTYNMIVDQRVETNITTPLENVPIEEIDFTRTNQCFPEND